jgi:hypothetical protein
MEEPEGFEKRRGERADRGVLRGIDPALEKRRVRRAALEQGRVLDGSGGVEDGHVDAVAGEDLPVPFGHGVVAAVGPAGGEGERARRDQIERVDRQRERAADQERRAERGPQPGLVDAILAQAPPPAPARRAPVP